ncbi:SET and MYND domain-containing protein 4-like isoform X3 [Rhodnius prolixus]|uniref:SET and MYND domain-containing protein 4-like isoform X3 n=1 Tax=Rhodnius prolixus TaxID=13249 RepID=UPI003D1898EC
MPNNNFEKIFKEVVRFLAHCDPEDYFISTQKIGTPIDFVRDNYVLLRDIELLPKPVQKARKSNKFSAKYRAEGNEAFKKNKDMAALEFYTKAVAFASTDSEELALGYANRSAVTFSLGDYGNCVRDIDRALHGHYPEKLIYKLLERKGKCLMELGRSEEAYNVFLISLESVSKSDMDAVKMNGFRHNVKRWMEKTQSENEAVAEKSVLEKPLKLPCLSHAPSGYIQVASNAVDICYSNTMGRHVVAAENIYPGDVIAVEKPFASVLLPEMYTFFCYMCKQRCHSLVPCLHCTEVLFCSEKCRTISWEQSHCVECNLLPTLKKIGCENMELLAVKMLLMASGNGKRLLELLENMKDLEKFDDPREKGFSEGKYLSDNYKSIHNLEKNADVRIYTDTFRRSLMAACILHGLKECTDFFKHYERKCKESPVFLDYINETPGGGGLTIAECITGAIILSYLFSVPCNAHEVAEMRLCPKGEEYSTDFVEIGAAIYPFLSLINHSCDPNVVRHNYNGDVVVLTAIQVIKKGDQIFDNYSYHHAVHSKELRQSQLLSQYFFVCKCPACLYDWPSYTSLPEKDPDYCEDAKKEEVEKSSLKFKSVLKEINCGKTEEVFSNYR